MYISERLIFELKQTNAFSEALMFGCGTSIFPKAIFRDLDLDKLVGYDINSEKISYQKRHFQNYSYADEYNIHFVNEKPNKKFPVTFAIAAVHEDPRNIMREMIDLTTKKGYVAIVDYDMKGMDFDDFLKRWACSSNQKKELNKLGEEKTYELHTSFGLDDCIKESEYLGLNTLYKNGDLESDYYSGDSTKHYIYIGQKD